MDSLATNRWRPHSEDALERKHNACADTNVLSVGCWMIRKPVKSSLVLENLSVAYDNDLENMKITAVGTAYSTGPPGCMLYRTDRTGSNPATCARCSLDLMTSRCGRFMAAMCRLWLTGNLRHFLLWSKESGSLFPCAVLERFSREAPSNTFSL